MFWSRDFGHGLDVCDSETVTVLHVDVSDLLLVFMLEFRVRVAL